MMRYMNKKQLMGIAIKLLIMSHGRRLLWLPFARKATFIAVCVSKPTSKAAPKIHSHLPRSNPVMVPLEHPPGVAYFDPA